ncbi:MULTISPECIES: NAD(P)/FAD-dependent oxidoreductase [unclassified Brevibacterium]|uniref:NAD(P)/FAD-dependent oxidoreductase n=1 Tax=unclassified Brevibacterium TaxID=2614124 RepID=UPI001E3EECB5|nr:MULTISPECIES: NAD(P)/FAD-dependent oxidoreductase [unclassified Brevibacterium]MCD1285340.1 thioredoxin reductase [Brevibacterium sp. CCUG 69071]MDK8434388.1 NAD(P)/FAD-dependent oxidoreductase [Brevibacterium sp. H-BE7]
MTTTQSSSVLPDPRTPSEVEVAVVGGGVGGLAASIALARSLRSVIVIDGGQPRNAPSAHAHNVIGHEGISPLELVAKGRREAADYGVEIVDDTVVTARSLGQPGNSASTQDAGASGPDGGSAADTIFELETSSGRLIRARRLIIATGLSDELPDIPGVAEGWGETALHCPYCHGYEVRGQNIGIIGTSALSYHQAMMFSQLSDRVTFVRHTAPAPDAEQTKMLEALGIGYVDARVESVSRSAAGTVLRLHQDSAATSATGDATDDTLTFDALTVSPYFRANADLFTQLGGTVVAHPSGMGSTIPTEMAGQTKVPGVWAIGNSADMSAMVVGSAASGVLAGAHVNADLIMSSFG